MADLFLNNRERELVDVDMMHYVGMANRMDRKLMKFAAFGILSVFSVEAGFLHIVLKYLPDPVLGISHAFSF